LAVSGLASGMDWQSTVQELANAERAPETQWQTQQAAINTQNSAYTNIKSEMTTLQADIQALQDPTLYDSAAAQSSDATIAIVSAASGATTGSFAFNINQLATAAQINGQSNVSNRLVSDGNPADVTVGSAGFATPVTAGTFTVNGAQVTIASTDTLQQVFDKISSATGNSVTASYNSTTDEINLSSSSEIVLGSATDSSNFLQSAGLFTNGGSSITSTGALGRVQTTVSMGNSDLTTAVTDGGSGNGAFTINGVTINYNASTDSIQNVLSRINSSAAGVTASYDSLNNRFVLSNKSTGDTGISMQDVTGNFLAATGLSNGTLQHGQNLTYTLNGGSNVLISQSNTITAASSGITGLSVTAVKPGSVTVGVSSDTSKISTAIQQFIKDYNTVQSDISSQQIVTTASDGTVTPGPLTGDLTADGIASGLRDAVFSPMSGLSGTIQMLSDLGIQTNGQDNTLSLTDTSTLTDALTNNLSGVKAFFTDTTNGWATQVNNFVNDTIGDNGTLINHQASLSAQSSDITTQISNLETKITSDSAHWTSEFEAMEQAQSQVNQELTYLTQQVNNGSL
jgi:flagellar hook-associated protein 2